MDTTQFIKEYGVEKAREVVEGTPELAEYCSTIDGKYYRIEINAVNIKHLKRLVESMDLVEYFGNDLVGAKQLLDFSKDCKTIELSGSVITVERLKQAIADYEQLFGNTETSELETLS